MRIAPYIPLRKVNSTVKIRRMAQTRFEARPDGSFWLHHENGETEQIAREHLTRRYLELARQGLKLPHPDNKREWVDLQCKLAAKLVEISKDGPINLGTRAAGAAVSLGGGGCGRGTAKQ